MAKSGRPTPRSSPRAAPALGCRRHLPEPRGNIIWLIGSVFAEHHDHWLVTHRYVGFEYLPKPLVAIAGRRKSEDIEEVAS